MAKNSNRKTANAFSFVLLMAGCFTAWIAYTYLPVATERLPLTMGCLTVGVLSAATLNWMVMKSPDRLWIRITITSMFGLVLLLPMLSFAAPRITYSRFGFTVYGTIPVPVLDITVNRHGIIWFRPKTHEITRAELDAINSSGVEVIIVGIGWDSIAQLTEDARLISKTTDLRVLPTPEAFALFNELRAKGRIVVLLAHCTC